MKSKQLIFHKKLKIKNYKLKISYLLIGFIGNSKVYLQIVLWESICVAFFQDSVCYYQMISKIFEKQHFQNVFELAKKQGKRRSMPVRKP